MAHATFRHRWPNAVTIGTIVYTMKASGGVLCRTAANTEKLRRSFIWYVSARARARH